MFLICGEALFDLFGEPGEDTVSFDARIGGSPFNVAMGLARLGENAAFFGGISKDALGEKLVEKFRKEGVSDHYILRTDYLTTLSLVQKDAHGHPAYTFYGANAADRMVTESDLPKLAELPAFLHVGSYTALLEPVAGSLKTLIERTRSHTLISFDPNIRPTVEPDMALWRRNTDTLATLSDIIKVSDEDLALISPEETVADIARRWLSNGPGLVIVTRGGDGASAYTSSFETHCPGIKVNVEDTVGAGDTFQAALLSGLNKLGAKDRKSLSGLDETSVNRLLNFAVRAAGITCSRRGADLPRLAELQKEWSELI